MIWLTGVWQLARDRAWQHDRFMPLGIRHWSLQEMARAFEFTLDEHVFFAVRLPRPTSAPLPCRCAGPPVHPESSGHGIHLVPWFGGAPRVVCRVETALAWAEGRRPPRHFQKTTREPIFAGLRAAKVANR